MNTSLYYYIELLSNNFIVCKHFAYMKVLFQCTNFSVLSMTKYFNTYDIVKKNTVLQTTAFFYICNLYKMYFLLFF